MVPPACIFLLSLLPFIAGSSSVLLSQHYLNHGDDQSSSPSDWDASVEPDQEFAAFYYSGMEKLAAAVSSGDAMATEVAASEIEAAAAEGKPNAQSLLGFLYSVGMAKERNTVKAFVYHKAAADGGNMLSKMVLAYTYYRQDDALVGIESSYINWLQMSDKAVELYSELAEASKDLPQWELVRIHNGAAENKEVFEKFRGVEDEDFRILEHQAQKGDAEAMYKIGKYHYFGWKGVRRDHAKALSWFLKAAEDGEFRSMELLGEIYAIGTGVERNYTKAFEWLKIASGQQLSSAYNRIGYLYVNGYGVEKNYTKAKDYFEKAAADDEAGAFYNLGVMYLKGLGVKRNEKLACKYFISAANAKQPKALYQLAKMFHTGVAVKKNIPMAIALYKIIAEWGPWSSLSRWAQESYLQFDLGKALFLYTRMAELGYEVAQSNAAWILHYYGELSMCIEESGFCTEEERNKRALSLWRQASKQGNDHAALMVGNAYFYGQGVERDYSLAAEAYMLAKSQSNTEAMLKLGYMHEHGLGLPLDAHLAKRYYDLARAHDSAEVLNNRSFVSGC